MHTKIRVRSEFGRGSMFSFSVHRSESPSKLPQLPSHYPISPPKEGELTSERFEAQAAHPYVSNTNIPIEFQTKLLLIVDDIPTNRFVLKGLLRQFSSFLKMKEAQNGREAMQQITTSMELGYTNILVFMDLDMPIMNGYEAISMIRKLGESERIKVVVISAFNSEND